MVTMSSRPPSVVVMGVAGCGKSSVGSRLAGRLGVPFIDGDDLHPPANVEKMASGMPLTDDDRWPWLRDVGRALRNHDSTGLVVACSALKRVYRAVIHEEAPHVVFVHLHGEYDVIHARLTARAAHFMPPSLLTSQFDALESLGDREPGFTVDVDAPLDAVVDKALVATSEQTRSI